MADSYLINGVSLDRYCWSIQTAEGLQDTPEIRGQEIVIPGAHGALDLQADPSLPRRRYGPGRISFRMWLLAADPATGIVPADDDTEFGTYLANLEQLVRLFSARSLTIDHPRPDGTRRAVGYLAEPLKPVRERTSPWYGTVTAEVSIPGAFWLGASPVTATASLATGGALSLAGFAACDAPIADGLITLGPCSNPSVVQGGTFVAYDGIVSAGRELVIDCGDWSLGTGAGAVWAPDQSKIRYSPGPGWFELDPTAAGPSVVLTHTGGGSAQLTFSAYPKFLTS